MSEPMPIALIVIFSIHLIVFLCLYVKRKRAYHLYAASAFLWLILYQVSRLWWGEMTLFGYSAHVCFRLAAWLTTGLGLLMYLRSTRLFSRES
jgi:uncharacterized membrane protein YwaF